MKPVPVEVAAGVAADVLGGPVTVEVLKDKPGRRRTMRARGAAGSAIVKCYASDRAGTVAARITALASGPPEPVVPIVLHLDVERRLVILSDVPGTPLGVAVLDGDLDACRAAGAALAAWHGAWAGREARPLRPHGVDRELAALRERGVAGVAPALRRPWSCTTVVHRDLYEDQILIGSGVGLIDLDDTHRGPPELDVGNLAAHLALLDARSGSTAGAAAARAALAGYGDAGGELDAERLAQCQQLSAIRLECIHGISVHPAAGSPPSGLACELMARE